MKRGIAVLCLLLGCPNGLAASFESAAALYQRYDFQTAFREFEVLAREGDARAQTALALMYKSGEGIPPDMAAAYTWYRRAADQGYAPAQYQAGVMLAEGIGITADEEAAVALLTAAAESGYSKANDRLEALHAEPVTLIEEETIVPWSQQWDLSLPTDVRMNLEATDNAPVPTYRAQLGAMGSREAAVRLWDMLSKPNADLFASLSLTVHETKGDQALFRVQAGPFDDLSTAQRFCQRLTQHTGNGCLALKAR